jgi:hypothetical protein
MYPKLKIIVYFIFLNIGDLTFGITLVEPAWLMLCSEWDMGWKTTEFGFDFQWGHRFYSLLQFQTGCEAHQLPAQWLWGVKRLGHEAGHIPPPRIKVEPAWSYSSYYPCIFMAWFLIKHKDKFTITLFRNLKIWSTMWRFPAQIDKGMGKSRGLSSRFLEFPLLINIQSFILTHLSPPTETCDIPCQVTHFNILSL